MKKIISIVVILFAILMLGKEAKSAIVVTNLTPIQYNLVFNNGFYCGIAAGSGPVMFDGLGTESGDFPGGYNYSWVRVDPGLMPHTPLGAPMDYVYAGWTMSGYPSFAMSVGQYGLMTSPFKVLYNVSGADIYITLMP